MADPTINKPSNFTPLHDNWLSTAARPAKPAPAFTFGHDDDSGPELEILGAGTKAASQIAPTHAVKHQLMSHVPAPPFQPTLQGPQ